VTSETSTGLGFGTAALKLSTYFRMRPKMVDGRPVDDGEVTVPINFLPYVRPAAPDTKSSVMGLAPSSVALALAGRLVDANGNCRRLFFDLRRPARGRGGHRSRQQRRSAEGGS
jgi:hypothetical protein